MKRIISLALSLSLIAVPVFAGKLTKVQNKVLGHGVVAETTITKSDNHTVIITFKNNSGTLGTASLSPSQPHVKNLHYKLGGQHLWIDDLELGLTDDGKMGNVIINSKASDDTGFNRQKYKGLIATWAHGRK